MAELVFKLTLAAMHSVGIVYIAVTAIIIIQMYDLKVGIAGLQTGQADIRSNIVDLKNEMVAVKIRLESSELSGCCS